MAKNLKANGPGRNSISEQPFFDRLVALNKNMEALREDIKEVCVEARDADIKITHLKHAVKLYLETEDKRTAREEKEAEANRILRAMGPLGEAAVQASARISFAGDDGVPLEKDAAPWSLIERHRSI
jgi:uncharacterized protein (UPF0335 family)